MSFTGFKSRVKFISVLDPTKLTNYISEVLDAGLAGPLFRVGYPCHVVVSRRQCSDLLLYIFSGVTRRMPQRELLECIS